MSEIDLEWLKKNTDEVFDRLKGLVKEHPEVGLLISHLSCRMQAAFVGKVPCAVTGAEAGLIASSLAVLGALLMQVDIMERQAESGSGDDTKRD